MINLSKACVICQATESLNTNATIKISENEQYSVSVCSTCEDNASPKMMRASLIAILERINSSLLEITKYIGIEITLQSICNQRSQVASIPIEPSQETEQPSEQTVASQPQQKQQMSPRPSSAQGGGPQMLTKPIKRDQRRGGGAPAANPQFRNSKVLNKIKDPTGKPIELPKDIVIVQNENKIDSKSSGFADSSYKDGYRQCHVCNGEGGIFLEEKMKVCTTCGGSGLIQ